MAKGNLAACLDITLVYEGGMSTNKKDPGNWTGGKVGVGTLKGTKYGIAASAYPHLNIKALTIKQARAIYEQKYWAPVSGDLLPAGVDLNVFDYGVNSGPSRGVKALQSVIGAPVDGDMGPKTIILLREYVSTYDGKRVIQGVCAKRLSFLKSLAIWQTFKRGWSSRVADVEAKGVAMWLKAIGAGNVKAKLEKEAAKAEATATKQNGSAGGSVAGGVGAGGVDAATGSIDWLFVGGVAVAVVVVVAILVVHAKKNKERAAAYKSAAAAV